MTRETEKTIKTVSIFFLIITVVILGYFIADRFVLDVNLGNMIPHKAYSDFDRYTASTTPSQDGAAYVRLEGIYGNIHMTSKNRPQIYYTLDLAIETKTSTLATQIRTDRDQVVNTIRNVMADFRREDVENEVGREFLKKEIVRALSKRYNASEIKGIYIEKLLYEQKEQ
jgi:flagellar basal body-associated protein FliL